MSGQLEMNENVNVTLSVEIPYVLKDKLKFASYREKKAIKDLVREALEEYFEKKDNR